MGELTPKQSFKDAADELAEATEYAQSIGAFEGTRDTDPNSLVTRQYPGWYTSGLVDVESPEGRASFERQLVDDKINIYRLGASFGTGEQTLAASIPRSEGGITAPSRYSPPGSVSNVRADSVQIARLDGRRTTLTGRNAERAAAIIAGRAARVLGHAATKSASAKIEARKAR